MKWGRIEVRGVPVRVRLEGGDLVADDGTRYPSAKAKFLPPVVPPNFYAAGLNGYRSNNALVGSGADIVIPADSKGPVEYEGELVAVIGRAARNVSEKEILGYVSGYTLGNDVSERGWQKSDRTLWRAKNADTFKPMGPFVVDGIDPMNQTIEVRINGRTVSSYSTRGMIFSVAQYLARMSRYLTLQPGDLVEVVNDAIGVLANRVTK